MTKPSNPHRSIKLELLFIVLAIVLAGFLVFPIWYAGIDFPFYAKNVLLAIAGVLLIKYLFFLKHTWLNQYQKIKIALIPLSVPLIFIFIRMMNQFNTFMDEMPLADLMMDMPYEEQRFYAQYIKVEYVAVAVTAVVGSILLPFRLLVSVWREVNNR